MIYLFPSKLVNHYESTANLNVRSAPGQGGIISQVTAGSIGKLIIGPNTNSGARWWQITWANGVNGWSAENYIVKSNNTIPAGVPAVSLTVDGPSTVSPGSGVILRFFANNVSYCTGPANMTGRSVQNSTNGSTTINPTETGTYTIYCYRNTPINETQNDFPDARASVIVTVNSTPTVPLKIDLKANNSDGPIIILTNTSANLSWESPTGANGCWLGFTGGSSSPVNREGGTGTGNLSQSRTYNLACSLNGAIVSDSVVVNVSTQTLTPTISGINPSTAKVEDTIMVSGTNLYGNGVVFDGVNLSAYTTNYGTSDTSGNSMSFTVPTTASVGSHTVQIEQKIIGGRSNSVNLSVVSSNNAQAPTAYLNNASDQKNSVTVASGSPVNFIWGATNFNKCQMFKNGTLFNDGVYNSFGPNVPSYTGTFYVPNQTQDANYTLTCTGASGSATGKVQVYVGSSGSCLDTSTSRPLVCPANQTSTITTQTRTMSAYPTCGGAWTPVDNTGCTPINTPLAPTVNLSVNTSYNLGGRTTATPGTLMALDWSATNATSCTSSFGLIYNPNVPYGTQSIGYVYSTNTYTITCSNSAGVSASKDLLITVSSAQTCSDTTTTQTLQCPSGQAGAITQTRTMSAYPTCGGTWNTTSNTCAAAAADQSCNLPTYQYATCPAGYGGYKYQTRSILQSCVAGDWVTQYDYCSYTDRETDGGLIYNYTKSNLAAANSAFEAILKSFQELIKQGTIR